MSGIEPAIAIAAAKGAAGAAGRLAVEQTVRTFKTAPLKWEVGVVGAVRIVLPDAPESEVSDALAGVRRSLRPAKGLHPSNPNVWPIDAGGFEIDVTSNTFGSMDELDDDELTMLFDASGGASIGPSNEVEFEATEILEPTVSSLTTYLYPKSLPQVANIEGLFGVMRAIESDLSKGITNRGTFRWLVIIVDRRKAGDLFRALYNWSLDSGASVGEFSNGPGHQGVQISNPTDLQVHQAVRVLRITLGGFSQRIRNRG